LTAGKYIKALDLFEALKETWSNRSSEDSIMRPYRQCGMLVIDEIHERGESEWETRKLVNLIDHRYDRMLVTLLVGNIAPNEVTARLSPSIVSRMKETGGIINCDWPSYR
jgi:DNA replication protein DnaC